MRIVLQRVSTASVVVDREEVAAIGRGLLLLVGIETTDVEAQAVELAEKIRYLRVFEDDAGKMNLDVHAIGGEVLVVSQFTLAASTRKGRRPSFNSAAPPARAIEILHRFTTQLREAGLSVAEGRFGAKMEVALVNDGPVTLWLEASPRER